MKICSQCKIEPTSTPTNPYCRPCRREYDRVRRGPPKPKPTLAERFWAKVSKETEEREPGLGPCWIWTGSINTQSGYGMFQTNRLSKGGWRAPTQAHIIACQLVGKPLPEGYEWDHFCRQRPCVNPSHLEAVPHRENIKRGMSIVAGYMDSETFKCGHRKDSEHAYYRPDGKGRHCGTCSRKKASEDSSRRYWAKKRALELESA